MLRLLGILTLGNMIFGSRRCRCRRLGRSLLLGTMLGLLVSRADRNRFEEV